MGEFGPTGRPFGTSSHQLISRRCSYEIERQIHGKTAEYNNIQLYDHQLLLPFFAGKKSVGSVGSQSHRRQSFSSSSCECFAETPISVVRSAHSGRVEQASG